MKNVILFFSLLVLGACHKREFNTYVGNYECSLFTAEELPGEPTVYTISPGYEVTVVKDGKFVSLLGEKIHIDDIEEGETYSYGTGIIGDSLYFSLLFINDSLYQETIRIVEEKRTTTTYFGLKTK